MGLLTDFFVADRHDGPTYERRMRQEDEFEANCDGIDGQSIEYDDPMAVFTVTSHKGLTGVELSQLHALLAAETFSARAHSFAVVSTEEDEGLIEIFPENFVSRLARLPEQELDTLARRWAAEIESGPPRSATDLLAILRDLKALGSQALSSGKGLFMWYHP